MSGTRNTSGTTADPARIAASKAFNQSSTTTPGAFPEDDDYSNPYAASSIDPRVDKNPRSTGTSSSMAGAGAGAAMAGSGITGSSKPAGFNEYGSGAQTGSGYDQYDSAGTGTGATGMGQTSGISQTADPTSRREPYSTTAGSSGVDNAGNTSSYAPTSGTTGTTGTTSPGSDDTNKPTMGQKVMGALGLGGAAGGIATKEHRDRGNSAPSTTTGTSSYTSPAQTGPTHHRKESIPTTAYPAGSLDSPSARAPPNPANNSAIADDRAPGDGSGRAAIGSTSTYATHHLPSGDGTSRIVDPNFSDPNTYRKPESSHLGRDAAIGAGVGAGAAGLASHHDESGTQRSAPYGSSNVGSSGMGTSGVSSAGMGTSGIGSGNAEHTTFHDITTSRELHQGTTGPHAGHPGAFENTSSAVPSSTMGSSYAPTSGISTEPSHHYGRDAGIGAGAAGLGAAGYEAEKHRSNEPWSGTQGSATQAAPGSMTGSSYGPTSGTDPAMTTSDYQNFSNTSSSAYPSSSAAQPMTGTSQGLDSGREGHHYGRDAGVAGAGAAGLGAAGYEADKYRHPTGSTSGTDPAMTTTEYRNLGNTSSSAYPTSSTAQPMSGASQGVDSTRGGHHYGRDAGIAGGAAGLGAAGYEAETQHHPTGLTSDTAAGTASTSYPTPGSSRNEPYDDQRTSHTGRDAAVGAGAVGAAGVGAHEYEKHDEKLEKERTKEAEKRHKEAEKDARKEEKQMEKEEKKHDKAIAKEEKQEEKHGHNVLKKEGGVGTAGVATAAEAEHYRDEHDKDRKPSLMQRILHPNRSKRESDGGETSGLAAADEADRQHSAQYGGAAHDAYEPTTSRAGYADAPTSGYASQVTGGTGTTALAQGERGPSGSHATGLGNYSQDP